MPKTNIMKLQFTHLLTIFVLCVAVSACGTSGNDKAVIENYLSELNTEYLSLCKNTCIFETIALDLKGTTLVANVKFEGEQVKAGQLSDAIIQYALAIYMKEHTGQRLDDILNALGRMHGELAIVITDCDQDSKSCEISSSRLKQLVRLRPMELNFNEVRTNVKELLDQDKSYYRELCVAQDANFELQGGFATYTLTFRSSSDYAQYNQAKLTGKFVTSLKAEYQEYGELRPLVQELFESLQIEGYRFVYTAPNDDSPIRAAIPWRLID